MQNATEMEEDTNSKFIDFEVYISILIQIDREEKCFLKYIPATLALNSLSVIRGAVQTKLCLEKDVNVIKISQDILDRLLRDYNEELQTKIKKST